MMMRDIAAALSAPLIGDGTIDILGIADPSGETKASDLALAMSGEAVAALANCKARAVVVSADCNAALEQFDAVVTVKRPRVALAILTKLFAPPAGVDAGIHVSAIVASTAEVAASTSVGPFSVIGSHARIGERTIIHPHVTIGTNVTIGEDCLIYPGVRIGDNARIGNRVILHNNVSIGADGFSFVTPASGSIESAKAVGRVDAQNDTVLRINSLGTVVLEDDVEVGANAAIDRATIAVTQVGANTKIDNLVQIGHNVVIGRDCLICGMTGISGSVKIGDRVVVGGGVGVADHVRIGSDAVILAGSAVASNVPAKAVLAGRPAIPRDRAYEQLLLVNRLRSLFAEVASMKQRIQVLEQEIEAGDVCKADN